MKAYKKVRKLKDGKLYPLFIKKTVPYVFDEWLDAECVPTKGFAPRKGFHCCFYPIAPHLADELANGEKRVWVEVEVEDYTTYNRPMLQGGKWVLANKMKVIREVPKEEVEQLQDTGIKEMVEDGWVLASSIGVRGTIIHPVYKERIARLWNVDLNKKTEVTDPYYFCEQDGELWFCWE